MEKEFEEESRKLRTQILKDVEIYLVKYRDLAMLATEEAKRQQKKAELIKLKTKELTELTCKSFEEKLRNKMQEDLKKYEEATQSAYSKMILREKSMNIRWNEREKFIEREKKDFEKSILKQAEKRIEEFRKGLMTTQEQLNKEREIFEDMMGNLRERVSYQLIKNIIIFNSILKLNQFIRFPLNARSLKRKCTTGLL
ncbi:putative apicomplexan conserved with transmembrane region near the C-terminus [Cryptosporidium sp. chipmunk genotype I]|uniref:putative apicomplexan conserved with transmembrane region near the C-terminus n=1 Tax=Cryptosporidium sp. chipmunk genotype I TaxID=1280935 RepID=UPI00351A3126|nr:putative apicomplexan conserved with transmembrane region near the C-terminus [Cryptosporidium sp. chipmunk genotype I]